MADFRRYKPRRYSTPGRGRRFVVLGLIIMVLIVIIRAVFGGGTSSNTKTGNSNAPEITLVNLNTSTAAISNANSNANTNIATATEPDSATILTRCRQPVSLYGTKKVVALTFDLAANNPKAQEVVSLLTTQKVAASFFASGTFAEKNKDFLTTISRAGFGVFNRSYDNARFTALSAAEITNQLSKADQAVSAATGHSTKPFFRPPYGDYNDTVVTQARDQGYCTVTWTVDAFDWQEGMTVDAAKGRVLAKAKAGAIIVLHAGYDLTPTLVSSLVEALRAKGYGFVTLPALLGQ